MKNLYLLIVVLFLSFSACSTKNSNKKELDKITENIDKDNKEREWKDFGQFNVTETNNPSIIRFDGQNGSRIFFSTTFFADSQELEITTNTSEGIIQERYYLLNIKSDMIMFANNKHMLFFTINTPLTMAEGRSIENKTITIEGLLNIILANKTIGITREKSLMKFNSTTIR